MRSAGGGVSSAGIVQLEDTSIVGRLDVMGCFSGTETRANAGDFTDKCHDARRHTCLAGNRVARGEHAGRPDKLAYLVLCAFRLANCERVRALELPLCASGHD